MSANIGLLVLLLTVATVSGAVVSDTKERPKVILVSMDGFRHDYLSKANTPNFDAMHATGVSVPYVNNTFVTLTFPCHYTIVTGRYEESHGVVGNHMYDPQFDDYFGMGTTASKWWDGAEPIWTTAMKNGLKAGVYFWPGSESEIQGLVPTQWRPYSDHDPFEHRVRTMVGWMSRNDFDLGLVYFNEPDHSGHILGPDNPELVPVIEHMDGILGLLFEELEKGGLQEKVNVIVTSDHGMTAVDMDERLLNLWDYVDSNMVKDVVEEGVTIHILPQPGMEQRLVDRLSQVEHITVMKKEDIPDHFHYKNHRRVTPVFAYADEGWELSANVTKRRIWNPKGDHGYDNRIMTMKPIFTAKGPAFKAGYRGEPIRSVDIYPLICHLLGLEPAPNNGSLQRTSSLLVPEGPRDGASFLRYSAYICLGPVVYTFISKM